MNTFEELVKRAENILSSSPSEAEGIQEFYRVLDGMAPTEVIKYSDKASEKVRQLVEEYIESR